MKKRHAAYKYDIVSLFLFGLLKFKFHDIVLDKLVIIQENSALSMVAKENELFFN